MNTTRVFRASGAIALVAASACVTGREGWGRGRSIEVQADERMQARRSTIRVEDGTRDRVLNWIGVRAREGRPQIAHVRVLVFDDRDRDGACDPDEVVVAREAAGPAYKLILSDVRVPEATLRARGEARWSLALEADDGETPSIRVVVPFEPD